jgi:CelD/BcsL family acetyltransferase involved in cellulose biosynthesis
VSVFAIDPLDDPRWSRLLEQHPQASVFHSTAWLDALRRTYGYKSVVLTATPPGAELSCGLAFCEVSSWLGKRFVSLPFSDHCEPLVSRPEELGEILDFAGHTAQARRWKYLELRPRDGLPGSLAAVQAFSPSERYCLHRLDVSSGAGAVFRRFHPSCVRRAIRRAEREGLACHSGASAALLTDFHRLFRLSRRRHGMPPQPVAWFENLAATFRDRFRIYVAYKDEAPVAGILALTFRKTVVYKYGGSDARYHKLGGMPYLFWRMIQDAADRGVEELDLGRTAWSQLGLLAFKDHFGASRSMLTYYRHPATAVPMTDADWRFRTARRLVASMPEPAVNLAGKLLYKHLG